MRAGSVASDVCAKAERAISATRNITVEALVVFPVGVFVEVRPALVDARAVLTSAAI